MKFHLAGSSVRRLAGVLFALLACLVVAPSTVEAGCTSHVRVHDGLDSLVSYLDPLIVGEAAPALGRPASPTLPTAPRPCSGPSCSGNNSIPSAAPSVAETRYVEPWACPGPAASLPRLDAGFVATSSSPHLPLIAPDAIFHPPRATASRSDV